MTIVDEKPAQVNEVNSVPAMRPELEHALRREIELAIEPVLADFRNKSLTSVREQVDDAQRTAPVEDIREEEPRSDVAEDTGPIAQIAEQIGTDWVTSSLERGRDALCSERVQNGMRDTIERAFRAFLDTALELVPGESARRALQEDSERSLGELVQDALDRFCSDRILADLQQHAEAALHALVRLDIAAMLGEIWQAIQALVRAVIAAAQDQWQRLLQLLLHVLLKAAQEMIGGILKEGLAAIMPVPVKEIEESAETAKETVADRAQEVRDRLTERLEALQDRVKEEVAAVKERVAEGLQSAVKGGDSDTFGRPPTGRPPSLRSPSGRPPSGRPPTGRPPSGRPPSLTRRNT